MSKRNEKGHGPVNSGGWVAILALVLAIFAILIAAGVFGG